MRIHNIAIISLISVGALSLGWTMAQEKVPLPIQPKMEDVKTVTESPFTQEIINAYYKEADAVQTEGIDKLKNWLHKHIHDDADIQLNASLTIESYGVRERINENFLDKYLLIQNNIDSSKVSKTEMVETIVKSYTTSEDGQIATVKLQNKSRSKSFGDPEKSKPALLITSEGECTDELTMTNDIVQLLNRNCTLSTEATEIQL